jgi:hypothetical protein
MGRQEGRMARKGKGTGIRERREWTQRQGRGRNTMCSCCDKVGYRTNECWSKAAAGSKGKGEGVSAMEEEEKV